jgi:hypothetical protein
MEISVFVSSIEIWNQICRYDYEELKAGAIEESSLLIISLERLLFLKTLAIKEEKYYQDVLLLVDEILKRKYS